jgi:WD40 repeat protein
MRLALSALILATSFAPAAPVPEDKEKPTPKAKLLGTVVIDAEVLSAFWLGDGKHFVLCTPDKVLVYPREAVGTDKPKPFATLARPDQHRSGITRGPDGGLVVASFPSDKMNAENQLLLWSPKALLAGGEPKADRVIELDDKASGVWSSADGRSLFGMVWDRRAKGPDPRRFARLSMKTGEVRSSVPVSDYLADGDQFTGFTYHPPTDRLYLTTTTADHTSSEVQCREADGGKRLWTARLPGEPIPRGRYDQAAVSTSDDGLVVLVQHSVRVPRPVPPNQRPPARPEFDPGVAVTVIDGKTGEVKAAASREPSSDTRSGAGAAAVSPDGRLVFATIDRRPSVWDAATGAEVKGWARYDLDVIAAFAPKGGELLLVQRERKEERSPDGTRVVRTDVTSTAGVWDLSPVLK